MPKDALQDAIDEFVTKVRAISRQETLERLQAVLGVAGASTRRGPGRPRKVGAPKRGKGGKRDPKVLEALVAKLEAAIKSRPGQRIEQIASGLGTRAKELALPAKKLLAAKKIRTTGNRRATRYFPK